MRLKSIYCSSLILGVVLFSYSAINAQVVDKVKEAVEKTKDVTVETAKKAAEVTGDAAKKTKNVTVKTVKKAGDVVGDTPEKAGEIGDKTGSKAKEGSRMVVKVTDNLATPVAKKGRLLTVKTWDGTKWVSKKVWFAAKKSTSAVKDAVVGDDDQQP